MAFGILNWNRQGMMVIHRGIFVMAYSAIALSQMGCDSQTTGGGNGTGVDPDLFAVEVLDVRGNPVPSLLVSVCYGNCSEEGVAGSLPNAVARRSQPAPLDTFYADVDDRNIILHWTTSSETNNAGFEVQIQNGATWEALGFVDGHGTTTEAQTYSYTVVDPGFGTYTFRLKQIDFDGEFEYSGEFGVTLGLSVPLLLRPPIPNPSSGQVLIYFAVDEDQQVDISIYDLLGNLVATLFGGVVEGDELHTVSWNPADDSEILSGIYRLRVVGETHTDSVTVARTDGFGSGALVISLGRTDNDGVLRISDKTRFPSILGVSSFDRMDAAGNSVGEVQLTNNVTLILRDESNNEVQRYGRQLTETGNSFELFWE